YQGQYPELSLRQKDIEQSLNQEEGKFRRTLIKGEQQLKKMLAEKSNNKLSNITAQDAFYLYESFGFPLELTQEIISEAYPEDTLVTSDDFSQEFQKIRQQHSSSSRTASAGQFKGGLQNSSQVTTRYHTATHLLHASLRKQLGKQVQQKGSHITDQRLRFDFSYDQPIDENALKKVIDQINQWVQADLPVHCQEMLKSEALKQGALAFFVEKYPEKVTVYTIGLDPNKDWISKELCGGPHVQQTGQIGNVEVIKEQSIGAGIRRIYLRFVE
ncbi:alanine--tRNA ligase, partial [Candidatus Woesebacteria bacterium]|nr:alanine--tRNA ligase [Candidatus Woesebacteria bacterium]